FLRGLMEVVRMSGSGDLLKVMCLWVHAIKTVRPRFFFQRVVRFVHGRLQRRSRARNLRVPDHERDQVPCGRGVARRGNCMTEEPLPAWSLPTSAVERIELGEAWPGEVTREWAL